MTTTYDEARRLDSIDHDRRAGEHGACETGLCRAPGRDPETGEPIPGAVPWDDDDDRALAAAMAEAAHDRRQRWAAARLGAAVERRALVFLHTAHNDWSPIAETLLAADAARIGLVPSPTDPDGWARYRELVDVAMHAATARDEAAYAPSGARYYEDSDGFDERQRLANPAAYGRADGWPPIYTAGAIASGAFED